MTVVSICLSKNQLGRRAVRKRRDISSGLHLVKKRVVGNGNATTPLLQKTETWNPSCKAGS